MSKRKSIPTKIEKEILVKSARRCCLCYGLRGDFSEKRGQIAHIDHNPSNNSLGNLVFLCFEHHDAYDARTSQSKGFIKYEVMFYRNILFADVSEKLPRLSNKLDSLGQDRVRILQELLESLRKSDPHRSCFLSGYEIQKANEKGLLTIDPFYSDQLGAVGYCLSMGKEALVNQKPLYLNDQQPLILKQHDTAFIITEEFLFLPWELFAHLSPPSLLTSQGIFFATPSSVDPGYCGRLVLAITNQGIKKVEIRPGTTVATIEFILINLSPAGRKYHFKPYDQIK